MARSCWSALGARRGSDSSTLRRMNVFRDKTAIVTGGASGIGKAVSEALAESDAFVVVADIDGAAAEQVAEGIRRRGQKARAPRTA